MTHLPFLTKLQHLIVPVQQTLKRKSHRQQDLLDYGDMASSSNSTLLNDSSLTFLSSLSGTLFGAVVRLTN